jgi:rubrerythrin
MKTLIPSTLAAAAFVISSLLPAVGEAKVSEQTLQNLNAAYQGESNAASRYVKYAEKAVADGFPQVGKLFRAAAAAEAIHRDNHREAIVALGGKVATFQLDAVTPGATADNLQAAIKGESYERDTMYPQFLVQAKADDARAAIRTIEFAAAAEAEHAKLYQDALASLGKNADADYYVCPVCGATLTERPAKKCPTCRKGGDKFAKIN